MAMSKLRLYLPNIGANITETITDPSIINRITSVRRLKVGETITLFNSTGEYNAKLESISKKSIIASLEKKERVEESKEKTKIILAEAISKNSKFDLIVQKATELGVDEIIPMITEYSIKETINIERMSQIATSATEQSGQLRPPIIHEPMEFAQVLKLADKFILHPYPPASSLTRENLKNKKEICLMIGAEGGFSPSEIALSQASNATPIKLGQNILRTETASIAILSITNYLLNWS